MSRTEPRVAVVHEWLLDYAGSERVLREILAVLPGADLYTLIDRRSEELAAAIPQQARTTFLQWAPRPLPWLRFYVPLMPWAIESLDLSAYDIVVSSSHAVAKGVKTTPRQMHLAYVHTPMRYAWDMEDEYLRAAGLDRGLLGWAARRSLARLRRWDAASARGVHAMLANSAHVAGRIRRVYGREAEVLHPPVDVDAFQPGGAREDYYLTVSRLEAYKRVDLLVEAFARRPDRRLVVVGSGPELARLRAAAPANVEFAGRLPTAEVLAKMQRARAFLFAGVEDFGIVIAEAQACGTPVIALKQGGAAEIVQGEDAARPSGVFFAEQSAAALLDALARFERDAGRIAPLACRDNALRFDRARFREKFRHTLDRHWQRFTAGA